MAVSCYSRANWQTERRIYALVSQNNGKYFVNVFLHVGKDLYDMRLSFRNWLDFSIFINTQYRHFDQFIEGVC